MLHVPFNVPVVNITSYNAAIVAYMHNVLHWLSISQRIQYHITATVSRCVLRCSPSYLCDLCCPVSVLATRWVPCVLLRGVSFCSHGPVYLPVHVLCSEGPFVLWVLCFKWHLRNLSYRLRL